jgi:hypothetical protein
MGLGLDQLHKNPLNRIPDLIAQLIAFLVQNSSAAQASDFFHPPWDASWMEFLQYLDQNMQNDGQLPLPPDANPAHVFRLFYMLLQNLKVPLFDLKATKAALTGEHVATVNVNSMKGVLAGMGGFNRDVLGYVCNLCRFVVSKSTYLKFSQISYLGAALFSLMETEENMLSLLEINAIFEFLMFRSEDLFNSNLGKLVEDVEAMVKHSGTAIRRPTKALPMPDSDSE